MADMKLFLQILANASGLKREMGESHNAVTRFTQGAKREFDSLKGTMRSLQGTLAGIGVSLSVLKGFQSASGLQEAVLEVKMNLQEAGGDAGALNKQLDLVRQTASSIQKQMPFGAMEVVGIENVLLKAGLKMEDVTSKSGAAWAAAALATISKEAPAAMGEGLVAMASPFNIKGDQYGDLANYIQKVDQASVAKIPDLVEGMKYVAGTAANMKAPVQDVLRAMGAMSQQGIRGSMAGTSLNDFLLRLVGTSHIARKTMAALNQELARTGKKKLNFFDQKGTLKPFSTIIPELRKGLDGMNDKKKLFVMEKIFGEQGGRAAFALIHEGAGSWEEVGVNIGKADDMQGKLNTRMEGFSANLKSLVGTSQTTAAAIFDPWLNSLTKIVQKTNDAVDAAGKFATENPSKSLPVGIAGGAIGAALLAKWGVKGLGSVAGKILARGGSTAIGIAEGKLLESAVGVKSVFIVNWPISLGGSAADAIGGVAGGAAAGGAAKTAAKKGLGWVAKSGMGVAVSELAAAVLSVPVAVGAAGLAGGYAIGKYGINPMARSMTNWRTGSNHTSEGWIGEEIYDALHPQSRQNKSELKNDIKIDVHFDELGRAFTKVNDMNTRTDVKSLNRGSIWDALMTTEAM